MVRTTRGFDDALSLFSLWGFLALSLSVFLTIDVSAWQTTILMVLAGGGLLLEGNFLTMRHWIKNGIQGGEVSWLLAIVVGFIAIIVGILKMPILSIVNPKLDSFIGLIAIFSAGLIIVERWIR